ncbi:DUF2520 domain-containing protein [Haloechinothrix sp. LS1_15]|uniref:Rossmann-like and DUF2520 domain-containing protein n=1 Tax=Haloechinothrix sp. LS1_15 TaxID=2652248 RepID=UPI002946EDD7|nr:DUF2520 domain-containing protein [Haloechinothrix sp. LS1_15]MDV6011429.1 DUF2520 domain-containing protein [Haloechinothrix sp. LS1_15]
MERPARLSVGVVSAGRVGSVLGATLATAGHSVIAASGVSAASIRRCETLLPGVELARPDEVAARSDLVVLAIPDDALAGTVRGLVAAGALRSGQIVVHTSGAHGVDVLAPAAGVGALCVALHPAMTFTGREEDIQRLAACCVGVTAGDGDEAAYQVGEALAVEMGAEPVRIAEGVRPLYHAALTHGANHLLTLVADCVEVLRDAGIGNAERLIGPLLSASLDNALRHGGRALTGPVARGDTETVRTHLEVLGERAPRVADCYTALARRTAERAREDGLLAEGAAAEIESTLGGSR